MTEIVTSDGYLARHVDGYHFALAFDQEVVGKQATDELTSPTVASDIQAPRGWQVIGRSSLGVALGIDIAQTDQPAVGVNGSLFVPIELTAHAEPGQRLLPRLYKLMDGHAIGTPLRWDGHRLAFGRLLHLDALEQLDNHELHDAVEKHLLGFGEIQRGEADIEVKDNAINLPLAPWELKPNLNILGEPENLRPMLQEGMSGRAFALDNMNVELRGPKDLLGAFVVSSVLLSPGPYFCRVVEAVSPGGRLPQVPSAAWLDANRSRGLHLDHSPSHRGRQVEVINLSPEAVHPWADTRVAIKVFRPKGSNNGTSAQSTVAAWMKLDPTRRQELHRIGYNGGVQA